MFPTGTVPAPDAVAEAFRAELASGRLLDDTIASLYGVAWGFVTAVPLGLVIGRHALTRAALMPWVNFFRSLSPIAWIPFAIIWFGVGDPPAIFIAPYFRQDQKLLEFVLTQPPDRVSYRQLTPTDEDMQQIMKYAVKAGILKKPLDISDIIDRRFIPADIHPAKIEMATTSDR